MEQSSRDRLYTKECLESIKKEGVCWLAVIFNKVASVDRIPIPVECRKSVLMALVKGKMQPIEMIEKYRDAQKDLYVKSAST